MALSTDGTESVCGENAFTPLLFSLYFILFIHSAILHSQFSYTHYSPCVLFIIIILSVFYDSIHVLIVYVLSRANLLCIFTKSISTVILSKEVHLKMYESRGPGERVFGERGGTTPQTDSVPSVDRAISCFNKHIYRRHFRQSVVKTPYFHVP